MKKNMIDEIEKILRRNNLFQEYNDTEDGSFSEGEKILSLVDSLFKEGENAAATLGRMGGKKGGIARALKLSPERRREIAINATKVRWDKYKRKTNSTLSSGEEK